MMLSDLSCFCGASACAAVVKIPEPPGCSYQKILQITPKRTNILYFFLAAVQLYSPEGSGLNCHGRLPPEVPVI